jgi:hypothetical protein
MNKGTKKKINIRAFVALTAAVAGLGLPVSGFFNHLFQMDPMTLSRHAWMSAHNILGVIFVVFAIWHAALNRRALITHTRNFAMQIPFISREAALAVGVVALGLSLFVGHTFLAH